jgi:cytochrome c oxidase subunit 4
MPVPDRPLVKATPLRSYALTWLALLALLAITAASSFFDLGRLNLAINMAVALAKALLVVFVFMHVRRGTPMIRVFAVAGLLWLGLLVTLSFTDFLARYG